jgi:glycosyltransferase involved in cell wall biosynthesis
MKLLSVIIPAYNERDNIRNTAATVSNILEAADIPFELIFVSDGSKDETFLRIQEESLDDSRVKGIEFSRNFGKEAAIFAGLDTACGDCAVVIDCDLQHPPETIPKMYRLWEEGYDIVEGIKKSRGRESVIHRTFANSFYKLMTKGMKINMKSSSDFKLLDRKIINILTSLQETNTFFRALSFWTGFRSIQLEYKVQERVHGESKWSFGSLMKYAISNITSFSTAPLQFVTILGCISIVLSILLMIQTLVRFFMGKSVAGFTTVILLILIVGGAIMISLGIIGYYLARMYDEIKNRPKYIIWHKTENLEKEKEENLNK